MGHKNDCNWKEGGDHDTENIFNWDRKNACNWEGRYHTGEEEDVLGLSWEILWNGLRLLDSNYLSNAIRITSTLVNNLKKKIHTG